MGSCLVFVPSVTSGCSGGNMGSSQSTATFFAFSCAVFSFFLGSVGTREVGCVGGSDLTKIETRKEATDRPAFSTLEVNEGINRDVRDWAVMQLVAGDVSLTEMRLEVLLFLYFLMGTVDLIT